MSTANTANTANEAPRLPPCESCGGPQVANLGLASHYKTGLHPRGKTLWSRPLSYLNAVACLSCGLVKFFASDLDKLRQTTQQHPEWFVWRPTQVLTQWRHPQAP